MDVRVDEERTLSERAARYWAGVCYDDLPREAVRLAKRFLIDTNQAPSRPVVVVLNWDAALKEK